jgi:hypothetical protein
MKERAFFQGPGRTLVCILVLLLAADGQSARAHPRQAQVGGQVTTHAQSPADKPAPPTGLEKIDEVVKGCEKLSSLFTLYRRMENGRLKLYVEINEEQLDQPFLLQATFGTGSSSPEIVVGMPIKDVILRFSRTPDGRLLLIAPDLWHRAKAAVTSVAVERDFPASYFEIFEVVAKQEERQALLIEISDLFQGAIFWPDVRAQDSDSFDLHESLIDNYDLDLSKSFISSTTGLSDSLSIVVQYHFWRRSQASSTKAGNSMPEEVSGNPASEKAARSLPLKVIYHLRPLPDQGYRPRLADPRVGYFVNGMSSANRSGFETLDDTRRDPRILYINRWRLEKADPQAAHSPPKQPITFWIGKSVPAEHRAAIREGTLMWNRAFERLGFRDAIVVQQMPDAADWDEADARYNTIRWIKSPFSENDVHAVAFMHENPLTGEILSSSINLSSKFVRLAKSQIRDTLSPVRRSVKPPNSSARCEYGKGLWFQGWLGLMSLGLLGQPGVQVDEGAYIHALLRAAVAHEMGHALGLRHNFIASAFLNAEALSDAKTVAAVGVSASVMDYLPFNVFALRRPGVEYYPSTIGPYDNWAIEYGYKPFEAQRPEDELPELQLIATRSNEPGLAYHGDELADLYDPSIVRYDLGRDPLTYWEEVLALNQHLIQKLGSRKLTSDEDYLEFTRSLYALIQTQGEYACQILRYIGGLHIRRNGRDDIKEWPQLAPLSAAEQQRALRLLDIYLFTEGEWAIPHEYFGRLAGDAFALKDVRAESAFLIRDEVVKILQEVLFSLFSPGRLNLIVNNEYKVARPAETLTLQQLFTTVRRSIWKGLDQRRGVTGLERELQRSHLDLLTLLADGPVMVPGDARLWARHELRELGAKIAAARRGSQDAYTRLHLEESLTRINNAFPK